MNRPPMNRHIGRALAAVAMLGWAANVFAQAPSAPAGSRSHPGRPLALSQTHYRLRAGERAPIVAAQETLDFMRNAKSRSARIAEGDGKGLVVGPNASGDQVLLAASLLAKAGEYIATVAAVSADGEERTAAINVILEPLLPVPFGYALPPVVLLNGYQLGNVSSACPVSTSAPPSANTFGNLESQLYGAGTPRVYFFDNCVEDPNGLIEDLGNVLADVFPLIRYDTGGLVPQVDLVAHSMGGLIVRSYLAGLQANGTLSPPSNPRVRKFVEIAAPNFGSFIASDLSFFTGAQGGEMIPGSQLLWNLARWNQGGDDLRGVDALAIIGNAGSCCAVVSLLSGFSNASDGVVSVTSASLGFSSLGYAHDPTRTRILPYCHTTGLPTCSGPPIASAADTANIVQLFLANGSSWASTSLGSIPNQTQYGGVYFALENAAGSQYTALKNVYLGSQQLQPSGGSVDIFYDEFATAGSGIWTFQTVSTPNQSTTCGTSSAQGGYYSVFRCKYSPAIFSVGPFLPNAAGLVVQSGGNITVNGVGFGTLCSGCQVLAYPGPVALQVSSWTDAAISAFLPATFNGFVELFVEAAAGSDEINIMAQAQAQAPPTISLSPTHLQFAYTVGGTAPASQSVSVSNSGGGTFTWSATPSASWLTLTSAPGLLTVSVNPAGLSPNTYSGTINITGVGASNSPQSVAVTLIVSAATTPTPTISLSASQASFAYIAGGSVPAPQTISISNSGGGTLSWSASSNASWLSVTPSGTAPSTLTISANPNGLNVGSYSGAITLTAPGATNSPQTITVALSITAASPTIAVTSVTNAASSSPGAISPGEIIAIKGSGLGPATGVSFSVDPSTGMVDTSLAGTMVLFGGIPAPILYTSAGQVNAIVPYEVAGRSQVVMQVQYQGGSSVGTTLLLPVAAAAPGLFTFNSTGTGPAAAVNQDGSLNGSSNPAAAGSYVTLYFTGGGQTNPAGVTGSISGSQLKWLVQNVTVTVGGQPATVAFDGAAPTFIDGFLQLNIGVPSGVHGTVPVVVSVAGIASPATATLAVQ